MVFASSAALEEKNYKTTKLNYIRKKVILFAGEISSATVTILVRNRDATGGPHDSGQVKKQNSNFVMVCDKRIFSQYKTLS